MIDLKANDVALQDDPNFQGIWERTKPEIKFKHQVANFVRVRRLLPFRITRKVKAQIEAGERDAEKITEQVCGSLTTLVISVAIQMLVKFIVEWMLKRWSK